MTFSSCWHRAEMPNYPPLSQSRHFDAIVIGGGITGLTAAYLLKRAGKTVCVLERDRLGDGDTGNTSAHLTYVTDLRLTELVKKFGRDTAYHVWRAGSQAIDTIEQIAAHENIDCDFRRVDGFFHAPFDSKHDESDELRAESDLAHDLGFDTQYVAAAPIVRKPAIRFPNQAKFHPLKYLSGLARVIDGDGCEIHENSDVTEVTAEPLAVVAHGCAVTGDQLIIATHVPLLGTAGLMSGTLFQTKLHSYSSYAIGAMIKGQHLREVALWDTDMPYQYLRVDTSGDSTYVILGGADHKTGQAQHTEGRYHRLEDAMARLIPQAFVVDRWSGQVVETDDGLPYIGKTAERQFAATGFSGNGMTFGTIAGLMARDFVLGQQNAWQTIFEPSRKSVRGVWQNLKENFDYAYYLLKDRLSPASKETPEELAPGDGKVLTIHGEKVACSCDSEGNICQVSAICTHLHCVVHWNGAEQTWDCPCHGSRFRASGEVLAGPAETPLEPKNAQARMQVHLGNTARSEPKPGQSPDAQRD